MGKHVTFVASERETLSFKERRVSHQDRADALITLKATKELKALEDAFSALSKVLTPVIADVDCSENASEALYVAGCVLEIIRAYEGAAFQPINDVASQLYNEHVK